MAAPANFTQKVHQTSYPAISPLRPELSCKDKTIIITGAGSGIGAATALSFAEAGATRIAILGRTESKLLQTKLEVEKKHPDVKVYVAVADVANAESFGAAAHNIRMELGAWDIFVHNAAVFGDARPLVAADIDEWWSVFEINTKSIAIFAKHCLTKCRLPGATFIYVNSNAAAIPAEFLPPCSSYSVSKFASAKLTDHLATENPGLRVFTVNPGFIETHMSDMFLAAAKHAGPVPYDDAGLAADFFVWCSSVEAEFLRGKFLYSCWDVEEMQERKEEIAKDKGLLRLTWARPPFGPEV